VETLSSKRAATTYKDIRLKGLRGITGITMQLGGIPSGAIAKGMRNYYWGGIAIGEELTCSQGIHI
jgi:hypothetical protein